MATQEKRVLIVIAPRDFRDEELADPIKYLEKYEIGFDIISTTRGLAVGMLGGKVLVERTINDLLSDGIDPYEALFIVGGNGTPEHLWPDTNLQELVRIFGKKGKIISAICLAPAVLARAGILNGKTATIWNDDTAIAELRNGGAVYKPDPIVLDGRIITANGPSAAAGFGEKLAKAVIG